MKGRRKLKAKAAAMVSVCMAGAWVSGELVKEHAGPWPSSKAAPSLFMRFCGTGPDGDTNCAAVLDSRWAALDVDLPVLSFADGGPAIHRSRVVVPVAFIGLAYFVFLGVWFALAGPPRPWGYGWYAIPLVTVTGGAIGSAALTWIMLGELKARCSWCLAVHAVNGLLLAGTIWLRPRKTELIAARSAVRARDDPVAYAHATFTLGRAAHVMGFAALLIVGLWVYRSAKLGIRDEVAKLLPYKRFVDARRNDPVFLLREYRANPRRVIPERSSENGSADAASGPTLVVFSDFQCSHCACFASRWKDDFQRLWRGALRVSFRHFPLCRECNKTVERRIHPEACRASYAAEAARLQGGDEAFWRMHDLLFRHIRNLSKSPYADLAEQIGLDGDRLIEDMDGEAVKRAVDEDIALAEELGVTATPTVYLNGRLVPQFCLYSPVFWKAVSSDPSAWDRLSSRSQDGLESPSPGQSTETSVPQAVAGGLNP